MPDRYDVIFVGSSFATSFFLWEYLRRAAPNARVLVLERGEMRSHAWLISNRERWFAESQRPRGFVNRNPRKPWVVSLMFGGNSNYWVACAPRMLPEDFRLRSEYGIGVDWPLSYDDLEPHYSRAEEIMAVSGPTDNLLFPRSRPYPQLPHRFSEPDRLLKAAFPTQFFQQPAARPTLATRNRPRCCGSGICSLCPIDAKFTILNEMMHLYRDARVRLDTGAQVRVVETANERATGVVYKKADRELFAAGDLVVLGANALFNPHILLRSGLSHPVLGKGLHEQVGLGLVVRMGGVDNYQGSTVITGQGYMLYSGARRRERAGALIQTFNRPTLRLERGKWRQRLHIGLVFEDFRQPSNYVATSSEDPDTPETVYAGFSSHTERAIRAARQDVEKLLAALPVESVDIFGPTRSEAHIIGTTVMGNDPRESIVDRHLVHHRVRNLVVLGSGVFPTCSPTHPTLTLCALSLWSASHLLGR